MRLLRYILPAGIAGGVRPLSGIRLKSGIFPDRRGVGAVAG